MPPRRADTVFAVFAFVAALSPTLVLLLIFVPTDLPVAVRFAPALLPVVAALAAVLALRLAALLPALWPARPRLTGLFVAGISFVLCVAAFTATMLLVSTTAWAILWPLMKGFLIAGLLLYGWAPVLGGILAGHVAAKLPRA